VFPLVHITLYSKLPEATFPRTHSQLYLKCPSLQCTGLLNYNMMPFYLSISIANPF
jgi:hypothetical protein